MICSSAYCIFIVVLWKANTGVQHIVRRSCVLLCPVWAGSVRQQSCHNISSFASPRRHPISLTPLLRLTTGSVTHFELTQSVEPAPAVCLRDIWRSQVCLFVCSWQKTHVRGCVDMDSDWYFHCHQECLWGLYDSLGSGTSADFNH